MGKNQAYKAMQRARLSGPDGTEEVEDGMVDGTFHSPEWHAARLASLNKSHTVTWEEFKRKQKLLLLWMLSMFSHIVLAVVGLSSIFITTTKQEEELKKGELEADKDRMMREYRVQLDADRARKLAVGKNHSGMKLHHSKAKRDRDLKKKRSSKKRKHRRKSSDSSSCDSSFESSSSDDEEREARRLRFKSRSKRTKKDKKHRSKSKHYSSDSEGSDGPMRLSRFFENVKN